jgi:hypothetical protein
MRKLLLIAGVAAVAVPGLANADTVCHHEKNNNRVVGTIAGAVGGGLIGNAITHGHGPGTALGAIAGGFAGNAIGGSSVHCDRYDNGYYDRDGGWHSASGYYERDGRWVRATSGAGYYDTDGRWVAEAPRGGYYDRYGHWVSTAPYAGDYSRDTAYGGGNVDYRLNRVEQDVRGLEASGRLSGRDANHAFRDLNDIRYRETRMRNDHGGLTGGDMADLNARINGVQARVDSQAD